MARNTIYYGPPGTGKTYLLQSLMSDYIDYELSDNQLRDAYTLESEDWILIVMILLQHKGKMSSREIQSKVDELKLGIPVNAPSVLDKHSVEHPPIPNIIREQPRIFVCTESGDYYVDMFRVQQARPDFFKKFLSNAKVTKRYDFVTFHQSYSYESFIEGIRPEYVPETKSIDYSPKDGVFKSLCQRAGQHKEKEYAIFIDEINRGNISEIFGELISLIELDKREGEPGALSVVLPYSKEIFTIPRNVSVFGTMNSADRSIDQIDIALRRRFRFEPMLPNAKVIENELELQGFDAHNIDGVDLIKLFNALNTRIELLLDSQHLLGHAIFMTCKSLPDIIAVIKNSVIPLLEEYFYRDFQKIQMIFNDLDDMGELKEHAIYCHKELSSDLNFEYTGDYMIDDKKHFFVSPEITKESLEKIYK